MQALSWLHLSDLHRGQPGERTRWPTVRDPLLADLSARAAEFGPPDLILFSGDLAFSGQAGEYKLVEKSIDEIRTAVGGQPLLVVVPGNHDLRRPEHPGDVAGLAQYHENRDVRRAAFFAKSSTHRALRRLFRDFEKFFKQTVISDWDGRREALHLDYQLGGMPGDFLLRCELGGLRLGIVGLNSAFLQLTGGDYERRLALEPEQFAPAFGGDLPAFIDSTDAALLLFHHPPDWLATRCRRQFEQDIYPPERFLACFYGHMHESRFTGEIGAANIPRRYFQASSLFGLEHYGEGHQSRECGYAWYRLRRTDDRAGLLERFTRRALFRDDGSLALENDLRGGRYPQQFPVALRKKQVSARAASLQHLDGHRAPATLLNPFLQVGKITDPAQFVGRRELLRQIFEELHKGGNRSLVGPAQIGKSSLLSMVLKLGPARLSLPAESLVYLNLQLLADAGDFFDALCSELGLAPCRGYRLERQLRGRKIVLCLDEIEKLRSDRFPIEVREELRGLADGCDAPLSLLVASRTPLEELFPDAPGLTSPLSNICPQLEVMPFSDAECQELLSSRLAGTGVSFSSVEIDELIRKSQGHPAVLSQAAAALWNSRGQTG